jgi:hypothetical protein
MVLLLFFVFCLSQDEEGVTDSTDPSDDSVDSLNTDPPLVPADDTGSADHPDATAIPDAISSADQEDSALTSPSDESDLTVTIATDDPPITAESTPLPADEAAAKAIPPETALSTADSPNSSSPRATLHPPLQTPYQPPKVDMSNFRIISVIPPSASSYGGDEIAIVFEPDNLRFSSCRFGNVIVHGVMRDDHQLYCRAPEHQPGIVDLAVSKDGMEFFGSAEFKFTQSETLFIFYVVVPIVICVVVCAWATTNLRICGRKGIIGWWGFFAGRVKGQQRKILGQVNQSV